MPVTNTNMVNQEVVENKIERVESGMQNVEVSSKKED